jgi:hypothetical protein
MWRYASSCVFSGALRPLGQPRLCGGSSCSPMAVAVDARVRARCAGKLPGQVRRLRGRSDIDACARIEARVERARSPLPSPCRTTLCVPTGVATGGRHAHTQPCSSCPGVTAAELGLEASAPSSPARLRHAATAPRKPCRPPRPRPCPPHPGGRFTWRLRMRRNGTTGGGSAEPPSDRTVGPLRARIGDGQKSVGWARSPSISADGSSAFEGARIRDERIGRRRGSGTGARRLGGRRFAFRTLRWTS